MANTNVVGKVVTVEQPAHLLYTAFADMRNFLAAVPPDKKESIVATEDTIEGEVKGMRMGLKVAQRYPFSSILFEQFGNSPFPFNIAIFFDAIDVQKTNFHIELDAELPFMVKMMLGGKLQDAINQITDQLSMAFSGKIDPSKLTPEMMEEFKKRFN